jgi:hypothetical protein
MTRRARIWQIVAVLFTLANLGGLWLAAVQGELLHTAIHGVLLLLGVYLVWRLLPRRDPGY